MDEQKNGMDQAAQDSAPQAAPEGMPPVPPAPEPVAPQPGEPQQVNFDPQTGQPVAPQPAEPQQANFDPQTGQPLNQPPAPEPAAPQPQQNFDPQTGQPLNQPPAQPQQNFDPQTGQPVAQQPVSTGSWQATQTGAPQGYAPQPQYGFDPNTGAPVVPQQPKKSKSGLVVGIALAALAVVAIFLVVTFVVPGIGGGSPEQAVEAVVAERLDAFKNGDDDAIEEVSDIINDGWMDLAYGSTLEDCGTDSTEYARVMLDGFDYTIDGVDVDESAGTAEVEVTVTSRDVFEVIDNFEYMLDAYQSSDEYAYTTIDQDLERYGTMLIEAANNAELSSDNSFTLTLEEDGDGEWELDEDTWDVEIDWLFNTVGSRY